VIEMTRGNSEMNLPSPVVVLVGCMRPIAGANGTDLNPEMPYRLRKSIQVAHDKVRAGHHPVTLMLGGAQTVSTVSVSEAAFTAPYVQELGLRRSVDLVLEENSHNSLENLVNARAWVESHFPSDSVTVCLVSNSWHLRFLCGGAYLFTAQRLRWEAHPADGNRYRADGTDRCEDEIRGLHKMMLALACAGANYKLAPQFYREAIRRPDEHIAAAIRLRLGDAVVLPQSVDAAATAQ
jgi:hypothetical protein